MGCFLHCSQTLSLLSFSFQGSPTSLGHKGVSRIACSQAATPVSIRHFSVGVWEVPLPSSVGPRWISESSLFITDCVWHVPVSLFVTLNLPPPPLPLFHSSTHQLSHKCSSPSPSSSHAWHLSFHSLTQHLALCMSISGLRLPLPTPASPPPGSHYPSPSPSAVVSTPAPSIRAPVPPTLEGVRTRTRSRTCASCIFTPLISFHFPDSVIRTDQMLSWKEKKPPSRRSRLYYSCSFLLVCRISLRFLPAGSYHKDNLKNQLEICQRLQHFLLRVLSLSSSFFFFYFVTNDARSPLTKQSRCGAGSGGVIVARCLLCRSAISLYCIHTACAGLVVILPAFLLFLQIAVRKWHIGINANRWPIRSVI